jgi:hypothetical protein
MAVQLTTLAAIRQAVPRLAATSDAEVNRLIDEASGIVTAETRNGFGLASYVETCDPDNAGAIFLRNRPIASITAIDSGRTYATSIDLATVQFKAETGEVRVGYSGGFFPGDWGWFPGCGWQAYRVGYTAGYATIPPEIAGLCVRLVSRAAASLSVDYTIASQTEGQVSWTFANPVAIATAGILTDTDRRILARYKVWSL